MMTPERLAENLLAEQNERIARKVAERAFAEGWSEWRLNCILATNLHDKGRGMGIMLALATATRDPVNRRAREILRQLRRA